MTNVKLSLNCCISYRETNNEKLEDIKNTIYILIHRRRRLYVYRNTVRESSHISLFCGRNLFVKLCDGRRTHTRSWQVCLSDQRVCPFAWETNRPLPFIWATTGSLSSFPKLQTLYWLFKSHAEVWTSSSPYVSTLFIASNRNLRTSVFPGNLLYLICERKYLSLYP